MDTCNICCENFTKVLRKPFLCPICSFKTCQSCIKKYLLESINEAHCMNPECGIVWTRQFLINNFSISFLNGTYAKSRSEILLDNEKSKLPAAQSVIDEKNKKILLSSTINIIQQEIKDIFKEKTIIIEKLKNQQERGVKKSLMIHKKKLLENIKLKKNEIETIKIDINQSPGKSAIFIKSCPNDNCNGFLDKDYHCTMCNGDVCKNCNIVILNEKHKCSDENIESYKLMKKDCKGCPKCASMIYKIDGCDHMFCTRCNNSFSWKTGEFVRNNTNPHYYEWMRNNGNNMELSHNICDGEITIYNLNRHLNINKYSQIYPHNYDIICNFHRINAHIVHIEMVRYAIKDNLDLRIKYLLNSINDKIFTQTINRRDKINKRNEDILSILQTFTDVFNDINRKIVNTDNHKKINEFADELICLSDFTLKNLFNIPKLWISNINFDDIKRLFSCVRR